MKFAWSNLWPGLSTDDDNDDAYDKDIMHETIHDYIGSLEFLPNEPKTSCDMQN